MAESVQHASTSFDEAERVRSGREWSDADYEAHKKSGYSIDQSRTHLNESLVSANGLNQRDWVNHFLEDKMIDLNNDRKIKIDKWNEDHVGKINEKTGKPYHAKSYDKRLMFPVGEFKDKGTKKLPFDVFDAAIKRGNLRGKKDNGAQYRSSPVQQTIIGFGNSDEWQDDKLRRSISKALKSGNPTQQEHAKDLVVKKLAQPYLEKFKKDNPHMVIAQCVVQFDEDHPHMHLSYMPYLDNGLNGGLGSTNFEKVIKTDHPDYDEHDFYGDFYRHQHDDLKQIINDVDYQGFSFTLQPAKPRTEHSDMRVNQFNRFTKDNEDFFESLLKKQLQLQQKSDQLDDKSKELDDLKKEIEDNQKKIAEQRKLLTTQQLEVIAQKTINDQNAAKNEEDSKFNDKVAAKNKEESEKIKQQQEDLDNQKIKVNQANNMRDLAYIGTYVHGVQLRYPDVSIDLNDGTPVPMANRDVYGELHPNNAAREFLIAQPIDWLQDQESYWQTVQNEHVTKEATKIATESAQRLLDEAIQNNQQPKKSVIMPEVRVAIAKYNNQIKSNQSTSHDKSHDDLQR